MGFHEATVKAHSQISATVTAETKERLDRFAESRGLKKNFIVEQALLFFMEARSELPDEAFVPARILLDEEGFDSLVERLEGPPGPTKALGDLMRGRLD